MGKYSAAMKTSRKQEHIKHKIGLKKNQQIFLVPHYE